MNLLNLSSKRPQPAHCLSLGWALVSLLAVAPAATHAVSVQSFTASAAEQFAKGTLDGTAVDEEGRVRLAPALETLWGPEEGIVWSVATAATGGGVFVALSGPGRLIHIAPGQKPELWYEAKEETLVTAVTSDGAGGAYLGLSPEGLLLRARGPAKVERVAETGSLFVWALARADDGAIWIGTGSPGALLRYDQGQQLRTVFDAEQDPVRSIRVLPRGEVVIGTGDKGRLIQIGKDGRPFVWFDAEEEEIVSIARGEDGALYALAARGSKQVTSEEAPVGMAVNESVRVVASAPPGTEATPVEPIPEAMERISPARVRLQAPPGGALYRVDPASGWRAIWQSSNEVPFSLERREDGKLLIGTGDSGKLYLIDPQGRSSVLLRIASDQASAMAAGGAATVLIGGSRDARLERLGPGARRRGSYLTVPVDAGHAAEWGRLAWEAELPEGASLQWSVRAGNTAEPDITWSDWIAIGGGEKGEVATKAPATRWLQARADMKPSRSGQSPVLHHLELHYMPSNRPPVVSSLTVEAPGVVWSRGQTQSSRSSGPVVADDPVARRASGSLESLARLNPVRKSYEAGTRTLAWQAVDPDGDGLRYRLELRQEGSLHWLPLALDLDEEFYSWDARDFPDGSYRIRLTAEDSPDNPQGKQLGVERLSDLFFVDNTRPSVGNKEVLRQGRDSYEIRFVASDPGGKIAAVEAAVDGKSWEPVHPLDGVADSPEEHYELRLAPRADSLAIRSVRIRVTDVAGNLGGDLWVLEPDGANPRPAARSSP